jgi:hypothetical protein
MKFVLNKCYGGFDLSEEAQEILGQADFEIRRDDPDLLALIEEKGIQFVQGKYAKLKVVEVPESATDFILDEYDGWERIIYVVDGKLNFV